MTSCSDNLDFFSLNFFFPNSWPLSAESPLLRGLERQPRSVTVPLPACGPATVNCDQRDGACQCVLQKLLIGTMALTARPAATGEALFGAGPAPPTCQKFCVSCLPHVTRLARPGRGLGVRLETVPVPDSRGPAIPKA